MHYWPVLCFTVALVGNRLLQIVSLKQAFLGDESFSLFDFFFACSLV